MKNLKLFFFALSLSCACAQSNPPVAASKPDPKVAPVKRHPDGRPLGIPFTATKISEGAWRVVENGKPVIYRSTAFGFTKLSEEENGKIQSMIGNKPDATTGTPVGTPVAGKDGKSVPVQPHPDGRPLGIPPTATKISEGAWRVVENGKPVIYRTTAFGFTKLNEEQNGKIQRMINGNPDESTDVPAGLSVVEKDGKLFFKRTTPFGNYEWTKEKNDLTAVEQKVWKQTQASSAKGEAKK